MTRSRSRFGVLFALVGIAVAVAIGWLMVRNSDDANQQEAGAGAEDVEPLDERATRVRTVDGLENVDTTIFALGSIWAVTSALPDNFSPGEADASIVRIDPESLSFDAVIEGHGSQPTVTELGGVVWAKLDDRVAGFDAGGTEVATFPWDIRGSMIAGGRFLWLTDFRESGVSVVDPTSLEVVATLETGSFPVAPIFAFGHVWIPSSIDRTLTVIDESTAGSTTNLSVAVESESQFEDVTAIPDGATGDEVWLASVDGEVFGVGAGADTFGAVRTVSVDRPINRVYPAGERVLMLPISGQAVLVSDLSTGELLSEIPLDSIPVGAVIDGNRAWVSGDGTAETLSHIDLDGLTLIEQFEVGENSSNTTGPTQPFIVDDQVWVPNRGDDRLFAVAR